MARVLVWFVALAGLGLPALAQVNTGNVYGHVTDEQGMAVPGGTATLTGPAAPQTTSVDAQGLFRFLKVPPGNKYTVTVVMPGFTTVTRENVTVSVNQNTNVDIQLKLSNIQETVTVTSATPLLDTRKVETGQNFSHDELQEIPTSRDVYSLIQQIPGVQIDTVNVAGNQSAIAGGPDFITKGSGNVVYQIDGATTTDNTYGNPFQRQNGGTNTFFDYATFQDVEVATGGSIVEQQTSGITINVVTKRGTNELHGSARFNYASQNWQSDNTPQEAIDQNIPTTNTHFVREYGADLGGPIVRDKLWLWFAGSYQTINTNQVGFSSNFGTIPSPYIVNLEPWSAKLNGQITPNNSAQLYFQRSYREQFNDNLGATRDPNAATSLIIPTNFYKVEDSHVFSSDFFASLFVHYQQPDYTNLGNGSRDCNNIPFEIACNGRNDKEAFYNQGRFYDNYAYYWAKDPQKSANLNASKFFSTGNINHELKFSFNYRQQIADSATGWPGDQMYGSEYLYSSSNTALIARGVRPVYKNQFWAGTLGDTITMNNLTVQLGVRYDRQQAKNLPGRAFGNTVFPDVMPDGRPGLPTVYYHGAPDWQFDVTNWQPRVSATYALGDKKTTLLRASYAQFADQLGFIGYYGSGVPISNGYYYYWTDTNGDHRVQPNELGDFYSFYNDIDPATLPNVPNIIDPNLKVPKTTEFTVGADQQFGDDMAVSATFNYRKTKNLFTNIPNGSNGGTWALAGRTVCTDDNGNMGPCPAVAANGFTLNIDEPAYALTLPEEPTGVTITDRPEATQKYYGVDLSFVKRLSHNWMLRANFGWNNFTQGLTAASIQDPNNYWGGTNCGSPPGSSCIATGFSSKSAVFINANWQFNVNGLYQAPFGINLGANFFGRQGYPNPYYVRIRVRDAADVSHRYSIQIGNVDDFRYDNVYQLDLRLSKTFNLGKFSIIPAAEVFNVANANTVLQRYQRAGDYRVSTGKFSQNPFFNQILEVQSPRILRLGINVNF